MDKRKNKIFLKRAFSLMLSAVVLFTGLPLEMLAAPQSMESKVADEDVLLLQNDSKVPPINIKKCNKGLLDC